MWSQSVRCAVIRDRRTVTTDTASTAARRWVAAIPGSSHGSSRSCVKVTVVVAEGTVRVGLKDSNRLVRLDAATGRIQSRPTLPAPALGLAVIADEVWVGVTDADQERSFDAATGRPSRSWHVGDFPPIVTGDDETVYVSSNLSNRPSSTPSPQWPTTLNCAR